MKIISRIALILSCSMVGIASHITAAGTKVPVKPTVPAKPQEDKKSTPVKPVVVNQGILPGRSFLPSKLPKNLVPTEAEAKKLEAENKKKMQQQLQQNNLVEKYAGVDYALKDKAGQEEAGQDGELLMQAFPQKALNIGKQLSSAFKRAMPKWWDNKAMFYGPKGTGKSVLIKKLAKDNGCEYVKVYASALVNEYQGSGAQNIKREVESAIALAQRTGKRVVMNIEEIDAIAKVGSSDRNSKTEESATQTLWLLLDDYKNDPRVFFVCTTNHFDKLNPILKDRFRDSYLVEFSNPHEKLREDLIKMYMKQDEIVLEEVLKLKPVEAKRFLSQMAKLSNGMSTRAIENMVHSVKHHIEAEANPNKLSRQSFMQVLKESKRKSIENKDSKEEWKKFDEWAGRAHTTSGAVGLFTHILTVIKGVLGNNQQQGQNGG